MKRSILFICTLLTFAGTMFASSLSRDYYPVDDITKIECSMTFGDAVVEPTGGDEIIITMEYNNRYKIPEVEVNNGTLYITGKKKGTLIEECTVRILVPEDVDFESINISTGTGDVQIEDVSATAFNISVFNGDIKLETVEADEIFAESKSGDMKFSEVNSSKLKACAMSGDIEVIACEITELASETKTGDFSLNKTKLSTFDITSKSGSVVVKLPEVPENPSSITTSSGSIDIRIPRSSKFELDITSRSGRFDDDFYGDNFRINDKFKSKYNGGGTVISVQTSSGSINLDD